MKDFSKEIKAYALKNAIEFGKADSGRILPKLFQHGLDKGEIKEVMPKINELVKEVNSMSEEDRKKYFEKYESYVVEREIADKGLPELQNVGGRLVLRVAPFPSGAMHIGNAKTFILNALYVEKYKGRLILVIDDTIGSEKKPIEKEAYELIKDAFKWLGIKHEKKIVYKSDRLGLYYEYAEKLIKKGAAYVDYTPQEKMRELRAQGVESGDRHLPPNIQLGRWKEMFKMKEGEAVLRIKTNMQDPNPAFRDRVLFKISDREHPRTKKKYRVWPTLEMSWAVDDYLLGITHIIRGNDLMIESDMERFIWDIFGWRHREIIHTGMVNIEGVEDKISKSKSREEVKSGKFTGWDDPRTWSIQSLARRGISPLALREFVKEIGLNKQNINIPIDSLYSINRKMIDKETDRYFFVKDQRKIDIRNRPKEIKIVNLLMHPDKKESREVKIKDIYISIDDFLELKGKEIRLLHLYNIKLDKSESAEFTDLENKDIPRIQWVSEGVKTRILLPSGIWIEGLAEKAVKNLKVGEVIQFERVGFARFDGKKKGVCEFWFAFR